MTSMRPTFLWLALAALVAGCATPPAPSELVPALEGATFAASGKSLTVAPVAGEPQKDVLQVVTLSVDHAVIRESLAETLRRSGLFRAVSLDPGGDYRLATEVIAQKLDRYNLILLVRYELAEGASGRRVWAGNVFSVKSLSLGEAFSGAERTRRLREMVFRDNFAKLTARLNEVLSPSAGPRSTP